MLDRRLAFAWLLLSPLAACAKDEPAALQPPKAVPVASASAAALAKDVCAGGEVKDRISAPFFPKTAGGFCVDPMGEARTYGENAKLSMDEVCTTAFDGECEVYKRFGLKRVVALRYIDSAGKSSSVEVNLSQFADVAGAYGMFTKRVVADSDPVQLSVQPLNAGGAAVLGKTNAYVWKGLYLAELSFVTDDTKMTEAEMVRVSGVASSAIAKGIGERLPGTTDLPAAVKLLPKEDQLPLGVVLHSDAKPNAGFGAAAVGYYKTGDKRFRLVAVVKDDVDQAKDAWKGLRGRPGALPVANVGDEGAHFVLQEGDDHVKAEYVAARKDAALYAVGDEPLVLAKGDSPEKQASVKLTKEEKIAKLRAWLQAAPAAPKTAATATAVTKK